MLVADVEGALDEATSISIEELPVGAWVVKGFDSLFDEALSPAELSVLEAILATLGWDKSRTDELELVLGTSAAASLLSSIT